MPIKGLWIVDLYCLVSACSPGRTIDVLAEYFDSSELRMFESSQFDASEPKVKEAVGLFESGLQAEAEKLFKRMLKTSPGNVAAMRYLAILAAERGAFDEAIVLQQQALRTQPGNAILHYELGLSYKAVNELDNASACYQKAIQLDGSLYQAHFNLGNLLAMANQIGAAVNCYQQALTVNPRHQPSFGNLCLLLDQANRTKELETLCQKFSAIYVNVPHLHYFLGRVFQKQSLYPQAVDAYSRALALQPSSIVIH